MFDINSFVHLHTHTEYSFLDGAIRIKDLVKKVKKQGMSATAITDHGGLFGAIEFFDACKKEDIKPILGFEAYITAKGRFYKSKSPENRANHLILLAKNNVGWKNIMKLSSIGYLEGFYYKPRIDLDVLREYSEGIVATSACIAGAVPRAIIRDESVQKAREITEEYLSIFGEGNFFYELQKHGIPEEDIAFKEMISLGKELGVPFVVANDAHYLDKEDSKAHEVLLCLQSSDVMSNPKRFKFSTDEMYLKSPQEMSELFSELPEAMSNTRLIADMCDVEVHSKEQLPGFDIPNEFKDQNEYLRYLSTEGLKERYDEITPEIQERLDYELGIIEKMNFPGYFLIIRDFVIEADRLGISRGARGSAAGSLVAYCIGITAVDPIKYDLLFERFLNPERISMPDVDVDIADSDRYRVINYVVDKYGKDAVCQIINFGRLKAKNSVRDVARVFEVPVSESNKLSSMITEKTIAKSIVANPDLKAAIDANPRYQEIFDYASRLEGLVRQPGKHAGGVIIAPGDITGWSPLFKPVKDDYTMTQFDMGYVESVGLIKMDFLGLRTLSVLQNACQLIEKFHGVKIDLWKLEDGDEETYKVFHIGGTVDVFQFESKGMQEYLKKLKPTRIEDLIAMTALYRPGPMSNIDSFIARKHGREPIKYPHDMLKDILDVTYGIIVYQEQVMRIAQKMGGFSLGQADILRKAMGKKKMDVMDKMRPEFIEGALAQNIDKKAAEEVWALMEKFAEYGFNKAHATVYAHVSYQAAYLKAHYPREYMAAAMTSHIGEKDKFLNAKNEAERLGIKIMVPDVNHSEIECGIDEGGAITIGLSVIDGVGKAAEEIVSVRSKHGKFTSIFDLCKSVNTRIVNRKSLESLISAGALDSLPGTRAQKFEGIEMALQYASTFQKEREAGQTTLFGGADSVVTIPEPELPNGQKWSYSEVLEREKKVMNFYVSGHPLDHYKSEVNGFSTIKLSQSEFAKVSDGTSVVSAGMINSVKNIVTKKDGKPMAVFDLEDFYGSASFVVFPTLYPALSDFLSQGNMVLVRGKVDKKDPERPQIIVDKIMRLSDTMENLTKSIHLKLDTSDVDIEKVRDFYSNVKKFEGNVQFILHLNSDGYEYKVRSKNVKVAPSRELIELAESKFGRDSVYVSQRAV